ncbi:DUF7716 domain-containing protein [Iodobacter fluviatilis]|uniref:DUF7716 domain-containing protein n=1 Tax=Iodobacter fluviatilis TaxID=537 RepID=A0A377Q534_9NEIS|nr:hypothetical protein [Iodobacter fluviatilis]TCU82646.1 hypothetical protein EV682_11418 [Iodobacter fluviatilis]STQ89868.1 Uncharacterised protein [Iodobacter fluviatilis]
MRILLELNEVFVNPHMHSGWLFLGSKPWTLISKGFFYKVNMDLSPEEEKQEREKLVSEGWISTLSIEDIEDVIDNLSQQIEAPTQEQILAAFTFYYENDSFFECDED